MTPFLNRLKGTKERQDEERRLREQQDREFDRSAARDLERVLVKRREIKEKEKELEREKEKERLRGEARRWRAWKRGVLARREEGKIRIAVVLGDGRRAVRLFKEEEQLEEVYAWVECELEAVVDESLPPLPEARGPPTGYQQIYEFRLATSFPRVVLEIDGSGAREEVGKVGGGALKGGGTLVIEGLERRRESLGEERDEEDGAEDTE